MEHNFYKNMVGRTEKNVLLKYKGNQSINWNQIQVQKNIQYTSENENQKCSYYYKAYQFKQQQDTIKPAFLFLFFSRVTQTACQSVV